MKTRPLLLAGALMLPAVLSAMPDKKATEKKPAAGKAPTVAEAKAFLDDVETKLLALATDAGRAGWVQSTFITDDTEILAAQANERQIAATVVYAKKATRLDKVKLPGDLARKMKLLKLWLTLATPSDPKDSEELTRIPAATEGAYGKGKHCPPGRDKCLDLEDITKIMATTFDNGQLLDVWRGWHSIAPPLKKDFVRYVDLSNKGARELGFADNGAMWRSKYDMPP